MYPSEVEAVLRDVPGVGAAHVTDIVGACDAVEVAALVVSELPLSEIVAGVKARLSSFKVPTVWLIDGDWQRTPMTATGKVDKRTLQALLSSEGVRV